MSLQYNILWVDDKKENYQTLEIDKELENYLSSLFFEPHIYMYETVEEAEKNMKKCKYDVIFSDYNISENKNGRDFISDIRNNNINAEILFYTAQKESLEISFDRISFLRLQSDTSYDDLKNKMISVIELTIEKLNNLTNLRGLVMSEVSELDNKMENIISEYFLIQNETEKKNRRSFFDDTIIKHIENNIKDKIRSIDCTAKTCQLKLRNKEIEKIISSIDFESSIKAFTINALIEKLSFSFDEGNFYDIYLDQIIKNRNDLAHSYSQIENGEEILVTKKHGDRKFDKDQIKNIRENIKKYNNFFKKLAEHISDENSKIA